MKNKAIKHRTHGERGTSLYERWHGMKRRCADKSNPNYGGRGIEVCQEWAHDYIAFANWAKENGFREDLTLDRIDNDKGYGPDNCRWVDASAQQRNKRNNIKLEFNHEVHTQSEWARMCDLSRYIIHNRLERGWSVERTLTTPPLR